MKSWFVAGIVCNVAGCLCLSNRAVPSNIAIGWLFIVISIICGICFFFAYLDRIDALMKLYNIAASQAAQTNLLVRIDQHLASISKSMNDMSAKTSNVDKHLCESMNWFGENLPAMLCSDADELNG